MTIWSTLASLLGVRDDQVDDALASEQCARHTLSRRGLLLGAASVAPMLATSRTWSLPAMSRRPRARLRTYTDATIYLSGTRMFERRVSYEPSVSLDGITFVKPTMTWQPIELTLGAVGLK